MLDALFGAEEEFDYTSTTTPAPLRRPGAGGLERASRRRRRAREGRPAGRPSSCAALGSPARLAGQLGIATMEAAAAQSARSRARRRSASSRRCAPASRRRGVAGSTFDHVAREARRLARPAALLLRHQGAAAGRGRPPRLRAAHGALDAQLAPARDADDFIDVLVASLEATRRARTPSSSRVVFELFTLSRRNEDIAAEYAELMRRTREQVAALLGAQAGRRRAAPARRARGDRRVLFCARRRPRLRMLAEPERDFARRSTPARSRSAR